MASNCYGYINRFITNASNGVEDNENLSKVLKNFVDIKKLSEEEYSKLSPEEQFKYDKSIADYKNVAIEVVKEMYFANGFSDIPDIKFEEEVNGDKVAARGQSGVIYINVEELLGKSPTEVVSILAHEAVHSEKITESTGSKQREEVFVKEKEEQVKERYKEEKEGLSEKEQEEYLAKLKEENKELLDYSESLEADSFSEDVEGYNASFAIDHHEDIEESWTKTVGKDVNKFLLKYIVPEKLKQLPYDVADYVTYCSQNGYNPANIYGGDTKQAALNDSKIGLLPTLSFEDYKKKTNNPIDTLKAFSTVQGTIDIGKEVIEYVSMIWNASKAAEKSTKKTGTVKTSKTITSKPSIKTKIITTPEIKSSNAIKTSDVIKKWDEFLGTDTTNINPRTGEIDSNRIFSADGTKSIRFDKHEMNSYGTPKYHYHEETWTYDSSNDTMTVNNTLIRIKK